MMLSNFGSYNRFFVKCMDGSLGLQELPDNSVKLVYGSPPYPNAVRDYGTWRSKDYVKRIAPFIDAAKVKLREDGFLVINVKACREKHGSKMNSTRSLVVEKLGSRKKSGFYIVWILRFGLKATQLPLD